MYQETTTLKKIASLKKRIRAIQGGTYAGKTIAILLILIDLAQRDTTPTITSVVGESLPFLKRGALKDFLNILKIHNYFKEENWNATDHTYTLETGSKIEFFGMERADKARGPKRERLFINEANNISYEVFDQLESRTSDIIFLDWNPVGEFWFYDQVKNRPDVDYIVVNYLDNEALKPSQRETIELKKDRPYWWKVFGLGELYYPAERIYTGWEIIDEIPKEARLERYGLDFGFSVDPTAIVAVYYWNGGFVLDEIVYQRGLLIKNIADMFMSLPRALIKADAAEPRSIEELKSYGLMVMPSRRGADAVEKRIDTVQTLKIYITSRSLNVLKEYRSYNFLKETKTGRILRKPQGWDNHAMNAIEYALEDFVPPKPIPQSPIEVILSRGGTIKKEIGGRRYE